MKGPAIFVFLVATAFLTAAALGWAQYRAQPMHQCMAHSQQTAAAHPYSVYHAQAAMQMNAHHVAQHQAYQQQAQHQAWQHQAWHAQAHQATSVAVVPTWNHNHQGAHALVATASMSQAPVYQTMHASAMCSMTQKLHYHAGLSTSPTGVPYASATYLDMSKLSVDAGKYAPATSVNLNAANLTAMHSNHHKAASSVNLNAVNAAATHPTPNTAAASVNLAAAKYAAPGTVGAIPYAVSAHHCADIRTASDLFNIRLQASQTVNVNVNIYNAAPQLDAVSKHRYGALPPGSDFTQASTKCGCEFNKMSIQNQLIGLDRPMHARHSEPMWPGYSAVPNYPLTGSNPNLAYAGNLGAYGPSAGYNAMPMYANNAMTTGLYANPMYANNAMMTGLYANPMYANNAMMTGLYENPMYANNAMMSGWYANPYAETAMLGYPGFVAQPGMWADYGWNANAMPAAYMMAALSQIQTATVQNQLLLMDINYQLAQLQQASGPCEAHKGKFHYHQQFVQMQQQYVNQPAYVPQQQMPQVPVQMQQPMQVQMQHQAQTMHQHHHVVCQQNLWRPQKW